LATETSSDGSTHVSSTHTHTHTHTHTQVTGQLADNSTNQLAVSQVADWSSRGLVNSPKCLI